MAMTYTSLLAPKGTSGSILNWVGYSKLDTPVVLDEAQTLLYSILRVREMRSEWTFGMAVGNSSFLLPSRFLDPMGSITDNNGMEYDQQIQSVIKQRRAFEPLSGGALGNDPFTSGAAGASVMVVAIASAGGLTQGSDITLAGATSVDGVTVNGTFKVIAVFPLTNQIYIDTDGTNATGGVTGGGAAVTWTANKLVSGSATTWAIWDGSVQFDSAFDTATACRLLYYRQPILLSANVQSNFITSRYPTLLRTACMASAANFMRDDTEYQKQVGALNNLIQSAATADDLSYRGANFGTDTPNGR